MRNYLMTLGWAPSGDSEIVPWERIVAEFRLEDVVPSPAFFDVKKLTAFNGEYMRAMPVDEFIAACQPWLTGEHAPWPPDRFDPDVFAALAPLVQQRVSTLAEVPAYVDFLFMDEPPEDEASWSKAMKDGAGDVLVDTMSAFETVPWSADELKSTLTHVGESRGLKLAKAQAPVRVAVTGRTVGPPLFESLELLGRERTLGRLRAARRPALSRSRSRGPRQARTRLAGTRRARRVAASPAGRARRPRRRRRLVVGLLALLGLVTLYYVFNLFQVWRSARNDEARPADAIVVLGAAQYDGRPSPVLAARLDHALELWRAGLAPHIVVTGGKQEGDRYTEATAAAEYLIARGVPDSAILREVQGTSTWESLAATARILRNRGLERVLVVSDPYHSLRARETARELGLDAFASPTLTSPVDGWSEWKRMFREAAGVGVARFIGYRRLLRLTG